VKRNNEWRNFSSVNASAATRSTNFLGAFYRLQFASLPVKYDETPYVFHANGDEFIVLDSYTTDLPSTYLELHDGELNKRIMLRNNIPSELVDLASLVDHAVGTDRLRATPRSMPSN